MRIAARLVVVLALLTGFGTVEPAVHPEPADAAPPAGLADRLLTEKDLPSGYGHAPADPYTGYHDVLFDRSGTGGDQCRLPIEVPRPGHTPTASASALFVTDAKYAMDVESLTEVLSEPGPEAARARVAAAASLPQRCPRIETPRLTLWLEPKPLPGVGDTAAAIDVTINVKAEGIPGAYVDAMDTEIAVVARGGLSATVILHGYYPDHDADLATVTQTAVRKLGPFPAAG